MERINDMAANINKGLCYGLCRSMRFNIKSEKTQTKIRRQLLFYFRIENMRKRF